MVEKCVWCGETLEEHEEAYDGRPVPRVPCLGLKSNFVVANTASYESGYLSGLQHAKQVVADMAAVKEPYWLLGDKKIPMAMDVSHLMRTVAFNLSIHFESIIDKIQKDQANSLEK